MAKQKEAKKAKNETLEEMATDKEIKTPATVLDMEKDKNDIYSEKLHKIIKKAFEAMESKHFFCSIHYLQDDNGTINSFMMTEDFPIDNFEVVVREVLKFVHNERKKAAIYVPDGTIIDKG